MQPRATLRPSLLWHNMCLSSSTSSPLQSLLVNTASPVLKNIYDRFSFFLTSLSLPFATRQDIGKKGAHKKIAGCTYGYYWEHRREDCQTWLLGIIRIKPSRVAKGWHEGVKFKCRIYKISSICTYNGDNSTLGDWILLQFYRLVRYLTVKIV